MAPRSFSETGAMGAGSGAGNSMRPETPSWGGGTPVVNGGPGQGMVGTPPPAAPSASSSSWGAGGGPLMAGTPPPPPKEYGRGEMNPEARPQVGGPQDTTGITPWVRQFLQDTGGMQRRFSFAEGGAVPTEDEGEMAMGPANGLMELMSKALGSVPEVLAYGRKKHGIGGGGGDEGVIPGAQAGNTRMPMVPPSQSESGVKPLQPMPGPLPPTSNPFGKRAEAAPEEGGVIDTDEEEMA